MLALQTAMDSGVLADEYAKHNSLWSAVFLDGLDEAIELSQEPKFNMDDAIKAYCRWFRTDHARWMLFVVGYDPDDPQVLENLCTFIRRGEKTNIALTNVRRDAELTEDDLDQIVKCIE